MYQINKQKSFFLKKKKKFLGGHMSFFWGHWYPCFGFLVTSPLGFKARVGCPIHIAEVNVMYIPRDPPLGLHLPTSWQPACRGEVALIRSHALRISVSQMLYQLS